MEDQNEQNNQDLVWNADQGSGREVSVECTGASCWVAAGSGMETVDLWMKAVAGTADLRIKISRTTNGIEVSVDRGDQSPPWWKPGMEPRLQISLLSGAVTATAVVGQQL
jgi:hypothetical protein